MTVIAKSSGFEHARHTDLLHGSSEFLYALLVGQLTWNLSAVFVGRAGRKRNIFWHGKSVTFRIVLLAQSVL